MIKSMTGFSKVEAKEKGAAATVEIKTLNGRFLDVNCRMPRSISHKELEVRDLCRSMLSRGNVSVYINLDTDESMNPNILNENAAIDIYEKLYGMKKKLKIKEDVKLEHLLHFSENFYQKNDDENTELFWKITIRALRNSLRMVDRMRKAEGQIIAADIQTRMKKVQKNIEKIEALGIDRIPEERDRLRQRIAQLFESDEIDEQRLQMEMVLIADKLDISEECLRLQSHLKFFSQVFKSKEPVGKKINFLLQEMNREVNTIASKANDAGISQLVVEVKEELECIREQAQNIE